MTGRTNKQIDKNLRNNIKSFRIQFTKAALSYDRQPMQDGTCTGVVVLVDDANVDDLGVKHARNARQHVRQRIAETATQDNKINQ
jgi:hypothetical protein